MSPRFAS